jgi:TP901 family phage tail tape measure protein
MAFTIKTIFTAVDKNLTSTMSKLDKTMSGFARNSMNLTAVMGGLGLAMGGVAIAGGILSKQIELDKNMKSLQAVTGTTNEEMQNFSKIITKVAKDTGMFTGDVAKSFEVVGSAMSDLLKFPDKLAMVTVAAAKFSKAGAGDMESATRVLTRTLTSFNLEAEKSTYVINALVASAVYGSASVEQVGASFDVVGSKAASMGLGIEESAAMIQLIAEKNKRYGAEAGTSLRNILNAPTMMLKPTGELADRIKKLGIDIVKVNNKTVPWLDRMKEMGKVMKDPVAMLSLFGTENIDVARSLLEGADALEKWTKAGTGTNAAMDAAEINASSLSNRITELSNAFFNATTTTDQSNKGLMFLSGTLKFITDNMDLIIKAILLGAAAWAIYSAAVWVAATGVGMVVTGMTIGLLPVIGIIYAIVAVVYSLIDSFKFFKEMFNKFMDGDIVGGLKALAAGIINIFTALFKPLTTLIDFIFDTDVTGFLDKATDWGIDAESPESATASVNKQISEKNSKETRETIVTVKNESSAAIATDKGTVRPGGMSKTL